MSSGGVHYFFEGFSLIKTKGLKRFVFVPLTINLVLFSVAFYFLFGQIEMGIAYVIDLVPEWLGWIKTAISFFLWPLAVISVLLIFALIFGTLANWIAAPFNGVLSEKVERHLTGQDLGDEGVMALVKDIPRTVGRELTKFIWYVPRAIGFLLLFFFLPIIGQVLWFLFNAWMMAIQYGDYPADNNRITFKSFRRILGRQRLTSLGFGAAVLGATMIPGVNLFVIPSAICGATLLWCERLQPKNHPMGH